MYISIDALEEAYNRTNQSGHPVKALLLTNPSNPLGQSYSLAQLEAAAAWAEEKGIHLICDEIYALSGFGEDEVFAAAEESGTDTCASIAPAFCSMATLRARRGLGLGDHVHCLWSFSKDFGASGIRVGALYTHNKQLLQAMDMCNNIMVCDSNTHTHIHTRAHICTYVSAHHTEFLSLTNINHTLHHSHTKTLFH